MYFRNLMSKGNAIALALAKPIISKVAKDANCVFSPLSLYLSLGLVATGSTGATQEQLLSFLKSSSIHEVNSFSSHSIDFVLADGSASGGPIVSFANGVWIDQSVSFKPHFKHVVGDVYKAASTRVDFINKALEVPRKVNAWAFKETNGLIKDILPDDAVTNLTRLIFANALYFRGTWDEKFDASKTKEHEFHLLNGSTIKVPLMTSNKKQYISAYDGFKVLRLPYEHGEDERRFSMYLYLPDAKNGLSALIDKLISQPGFIEEQHLPLEKVAVGDFLIPKFKISFGFQASKILKDQGLVLPFLPGGLTDMVDCPVVGSELYVSDIFHKSFIEVNEEGTEAAAATGVSMCGSPRVIDKLDFVADHPFLFFIREDMTGAVQFMGSVLNPLQSKPLVN